MTELIPAPRAENFGSSRTFQSAVTGEFGPLQVDAHGATEFQASMATATLGAVVLSEVAAMPHRVLRTRGSIDAGDHDFYKVSLQVAGTGIVRQDGREALLTPGDLTVYDTTRPFELVYDEDFRVLVAMFPRPLLRVTADAMRHVTARRIAGREGAGALAAPFLAGLGRKTLIGPGRVGPFLDDAVLDVLSACFTETLEEHRPSLETSRAASLLAQVQSCAEDHLSDSELGPAKLAEAQHISVRYLHKLFEAEGTTVNEWIRARRLERCRRDLADPQYRDWTISGIAARWGLINPSNFSRIFHEVYGLTPRQYRTTAAHRESKLSLGR
ncbi:helix-turn-helix domain-containing protein [Kocuria sp. NPDC057446]|uniref:AraC-like ligand-binding domain-containing protein n=1 Tax=Kocuria sp. NPDC057446 TaxID=3346137 RepID=UPI0036753F9C